MIDSYTIENLIKFYSVKKGNFNDIYSDLWNKIIHPFNKYLTKNNGI